jgi:aspartate aminotransferase-like enzyme
MTEAPRDTERAETPPPALGRFFLPGPTEVHPEVLAAMTRPMIPHRGGEMERLLTGVQPSLQRVFRTTRPVLIGSNSATGFMEMAARCGVRNRALSLVGGAFGDRFAAIVAATGRDVVRLEVPLGKTVEPDMLRDALRRSDVDAITLVHSETSTGALAPLEELLEVAREFDEVMTLVDAVSSLGAAPVETDAWQIDFVLTGSQKALALPPGLAFGVASERLVNLAKTIPERGAYFDVVAFDRAAAEHQPTFTPAISLYFALEAQLARIDREGGVEGAWRRHAAMRGVVEQWVDGRGGERGFSYLPPENRRAPAVSCLTVPPGVHARELVQRVKSNGWVVGTGYGALKPTTIRIGHMGIHTPEEVDALLGVIDTSLG